MKYLAFFTLLCLAAPLRPAHAQQVITICTPTPVPGGVSTCVPVSTTAPLPVTLSIHS